MAEPQMVLQRRICWPEPDATCVEGGCLYCEDGRWIAISHLRRLCERMRHHGKLLTHRGNGKQVDAMEAFEYGRTHRWGNASTRSVPRAADGRYAKSKETDGPERQPAREPGASPVPDR